jgi:hypothetical protein
MIPRKGRPPQLGATRSKTFIVKMHASEVEMLSHLATLKECSNAEVIRELVRGSYEKAHKGGKVPKLATPYPEAP